MPRKKTEPKTIPIDSIKHAEESRTNIPTKELRDFLADDEQEPRMKLYPRNPDLDPQLVWRGKDDQDSHDLEVPVVPVYIQEKVHPQAIIQDIKRYAKQDKPATFDLFGSDFNGLDFDQLIEFYQHQQKWQNRMILGDSLQVMASLAEKEGLKGQVQMIYLDPPYGIKFGSNWQVSTRKRDVKDGKAEDMTRQPEQIRAFRDTWALGIHSYLAYLRDRLVLARALLTESGSVFVQIGDENVHLVRCLMDEVFGVDCFVSQIAYTTTGGFSGTKTLSRVGDYLIWYAKNLGAIKYRQLYQEKASILESDSSKYDQVELFNGLRRTISKEEQLCETSLPIDSRIYRKDNIVGQGATDEDTPIIFEGKTYQPPKNTHWKAHYPAGVERLILSKRIEATSKSLAYIRFFDDFPIQPINNMWFDVGGTVQSRSDPKIYVVQTGTSIIQRCILMTTDPGDLVLDPTCGSGTTAYVAEQWGRRWITCDTSRVALSLARTRLMTAKFPFYRLKDSKEGIGFVYKTVPHVTLKAIANNEEIDSIHAKWQAQLEPIQTQLNALLKQDWEEWAIPREVEKGWTKKAKDLLAQWWALKQQLQEEIDESIARHSSTETLYEQPLEDKKRVRVTGPFTVESLSPHRMLTTDASVDEIKAQMSPQVKADSFETLILDNLKQSGVENTVKNERLVFDRLEPYAGNLIHAIGEYTDKQGELKQVAVFIGPEQGTVSPLHIKEATKEAIKDFDVLVICGFAFDPHVSEEAKHYGKKLVVLLTKMNPDLTMGEDLLKKTGCGNLFMVFGEPDIQPVDAETGKLKPLPNGQYQIEILGVDIYDPTKGIVKFHSTDDIACWFIDTDYDGESFFVRHVYFTGAGDPYKKLKSVLKAEIDEAAWAEIYSTLSRPFDKPVTGKIAVKVINHYGDEVLKVFGV
ncbi:MAG: site-specific DNA-methyltransferase [Candidatus Parabeggiatoa sp. nov. 3]|nr:MAG: site-specific DNA-methyltransferase [Gammaproteobacteria bacterium]RKZ86451.1 MAG: site-specific DNA-methyltransferase [Gammaproteobacteria bacterium]